VSGLGKRFASELWLDVSKFFLLFTTLSFLTFCLSGTISSGYSSKVEVSGTILDSSLSLEILCFLSLVFLFFLLICSTHFFLN